MTLVYFCLDRTRMTHCYDNVAKKENQRWRKHQMFSIPSSIFLPVLLYQRDATKLYKTAALQIQLSSLLFTPSSILYPLLTVFKRLPDHGHHSVNLIFHSQSQSLWLPISSQKRELLKLFCSQTLTWPQQPLSPMPEPRKIQRPQMTLPWPPQPTSQTQEPPSSASTRSKSIDYFSPPS